MEPGTPEPSLIERMGGMEAASGLLVSAVENFYIKLITDPALATFFEGVQMERLKAKQVEFLAYVFGGPQRYSGRDLAEAHEALIRDKGAPPAPALTGRCGRARDGSARTHAAAPFAATPPPLTRRPRRTPPPPRPPGLNETHFDIVAAHFHACLTELGAPAELVDEALRILATARPIFERQSPPPPPGAPGAQGEAAPGPLDAEAPSPEDTAAIATHLQAVLAVREAELTKVRHKVRRMVAHSDPAALERLRAALRLRGAGLVELFDESLAAGRAAPGGAP
jgi:truncated hemoglobin YjbI